MHPRTTELPDRVLVERIRAGDAVAMDEVFVQYFARLVGFARSLTPRQDIAEDLAQDALFAVWERRNGLVIHTTLANYLFAAVRNAALNHLRADRRRARWAELARPDDEALRGAGVAQPASSTDTALEADERARLLRSAIDALPQRYRQVLSLRANGLEYDAVGALLGIPAKTAQTRVLRGIAMLRDRLRRKF